MNRQILQQAISMPPAAPDIDLDPAVYKTLLESTLAIPWKIDWATMTFAYIGPQIEELLGWQRDSWRTVDDWVMRMHPDDRDYVVNFCVSQSQAGVDHEADYRALTADGGYRWIRDVVHVVRTPAGAVDSLVGFMFDITERKKSEEEIVRLQKELEAQSLTDGLTGIANRRMFDMRLESEWKNSARTRQPLSLLIVDVDYFKQYNDVYGHIRGDACLVSVATALKSVGERPRDIVARYGGEEFVLLLPETNANAALELAEDCVAGVAERAIPHGQSAAGACVTISIGVGTVIADAAICPKTLVDAVDKALYTAKEKGRNRIEIARF